MNYLSKYVDVIPFENTYVLFNTINGDILQFDNLMILQENDQFAIGDLPDDDLQYLKMRDFFADETSIREKIEELAPQIEKDTDISISFSEACNLNCVYCYQCKWNKSDSIASNKLEESIMDYVKGIIPKIEVIEGTLHIRFIGGEPLLKKNAILHMTKEIEKINQGRIPVRYYIDTNGTLLDSDFIQEFSNLQMHIPLSLPQDHDKLRNNSFEAAFGNLEKFSSLLDGEKYSLVIRYNVHKSNVDSVETLINMMEGLNIPFHMDVERIVDNGNFINNLSEVEFDKLYCNIIYPILCKYHIEADLLPKVGINRHCGGSNILSRKYLSNGQIVLCDGISKDAAIGNLNLQPLEDQCIGCYDFGYCGGNKNCEPHCSGKYKYKEGARYRVLTYVKIINDESQN